MRDMLIPFHVILQPGQIFKPAKFGFQKGSRTNLDYPQYENL